MWSLCATPSEDVLSLLQRFYNLYIPRLVEGTPFIQIKEKKMKKKVNTSPSHTPEIMIE